MKQTIFIFCLLFSVVVINKHSHACEPVPPTMQSSLCERVNGADVIFEGKVVKVLENKGKGMGAEFEVTRYFKGMGPKKLIVYGFGYGADCNIAVYQDDVRIVFAKGDPRKDSFLMANRISGLDQAQVVTKETTDEIMRITKQGSFAPQL